MKIKQSLKNLAVLAFSAVSLCLVYLINQTPTQASTQYLVQTSSRLGSGPTALQILTHSSWEPANTWFKTSPAPNFVTIGDNYYQFEYWTVNGQLKHGNPIELYMSRRHSAVAIYKDVPSIQQKIRIVHFGDIEDGDWSAFMQVLHNYQPVDEYQTIFLGSGDYITLVGNMPYFKTAVDRFVFNTRFTQDDIILALGNHDDPGAVMTDANWNNVWHHTRPTEDVMIKDQLLIAWMHAEHSKLDTLETKIQEKRQECPECVAIFIGHKPLVLEPGLEAYQAYLLPHGREKTLQILSKYNFDFYLTGHLEIHNLQAVDGVLHNRVTPGRRGFEEILIDYENGEIKNLQIISRDRNFNPTYHKVPTLNSSVNLQQESTQVPTPTPTVAASSCHQTCNTNSDCQSGQTCARNYNVRPDGAMICLNFSCPAETNCKCAWQR